MMVPPAAARWAVRWTAVGAMVVLTGLLLLAVFLLPAGVGVGSASATPGAEGSAAAYGAATSDALDGASVLRKGPYLMYAGDNTRMAVMWQTTTAAPPPTALEWGYTPDYRRSVDEVQEVDTAADGSLFRCDLTGLQPGALVHYRLTVGEESYGGSFRVAPPEEADRATLYAASDTQDNPQAYGGVIAALLADMAAEPGGRQSICLHAGDFVGAGLKEQAWDTEFFSREYPAVGRFLADVPVMGALGNHESYAFQMGSDDPTGAGPLLRAYWPDLFSASPPHFYYSFDYGPVHVAVLDTWTCAFDSGSEQYDWLERDLSASTKAWEIVMLHNPVYAAGSLRDNGALIRQHLQPLLERAGVSLVLAGHHHFYSRCEVGGIQYLTLGGGGGELSKPVLSAPYVVAGASAHHFVRLECRGGALTGTALGVDGAVLDRFVLAPSWSDLPHDALSGYGVTLAQLAGISSGYEDGTFRPDQSIPRSQFVKMADATFAINEAQPATATFSDVPAHHFYFGHIEGAYASQLVNGIGGGLFGPELTITREQALAIIARRVAAEAGFDLNAMTEAEISSALAAFGDRASVSASLREEMAFAVNQGITRGTSAGNLAPQEAISRLAAATMLIRADGGPRN